jgi:threonine dehydratase
MQFLLDSFKDPDVSNCIPIEYVYTMMNATGQNVELLNQLHQGCMDGSIVTHEDIVKVQDKVKRLHDTNIDHQLGTLAQEICARLNSTVVGIDTSSISEACKNLALNPKGVIDATTALQLEAMLYKELQQRSMPYK